jgi:cytochrome c
LKRTVLFRYIIFNLFNNVEMPMNRTAFFCVLSLVLSSPAFATKELAQKNNCMACHAVDKKLVGPAYQEVARKYAGQKDGAAVLANSIKTGGSGKWGPVPMPAQAALNDADALALAKWVLAGSK